MNKGMPTTFEEKCILIADEYLEHERAKQKEKEMMEEVAKSMNDECVSLEPPVSKRNRKLDRQDDWTRGRTKKQFFKSHK